jgi:hypothetical protein
MAELRECAQCGAAFAPRREHARFCSTVCRMAWNTERSGVAAAPLVAIDWSVTAMTDAASRFTWAGTWDLPRTAAAASETVWWITLVDATLVRYHRRDYETTLAAQPAERRRKTEETLAGLRFVRNQIGCSVDPAEFIRRPDDVGGRASANAKAWVWRPQSAPSLKALSVSSRDWEMSRYRSYQARLAGRDVTSAFARCALFLEQAAAAASAGETRPAGGRRVLSLVTRGHNAPCSWRCSAACGVFEFSRLPLVKMQKRRLTPQVKRRFGCRVGCQASRVSVLCPRRVSWMRRLLSWSWPSMHLA